MRNFLRGTVIAIIVICSTFCANAIDFRGGEKTVGVQLGYADYNVAPQVGIEFTYRFAQHFRIAPSINYVFRHHDADGLIFDINGEVPFDITPRIDLFPYVGLNFSSWGLKENHPQWADNRTRISRFGLNVGGGASFKLTPNMRLSARAEYCFIKEFRGANAYLGLGFIF